MSGVAPVNFDGKDLYTPGYYAKRNMDALNVGGASGSNLLLLGECKAGIPFNATTDYPNANDRINWVSDTSELIAKLRDGEAYDGALFALTPSNQEGINGAPKVGVIRMNSATRSTGTVDADSGGETVINLKSKDYGLYTTQIRRKIAAGTTKGKKITVQFESNTVEGDDIAYEQFTLQYTGAGASCSLTLDPAGDMVMTPADTDPPVTIDLTSFDTIANLVTYINTLSKYSAVLVGNGTDLVSLLDKVVIGDAINIKTAKTLSANLQACIDWINNSSQYMIATLYPAANRRVPDNDAAYVFLTGGAEGGSVTQQNWQDALDQICKAVDASFVGVLTSNAAVHASLGAHCTTMNGSQGKNERQGGAGSALADVKATKLASLAAINNPYVGYFCSEIKRYNKLGVLTTYAGYMGMCEILGIAAGNTITTSPTNKMLNAVAVNEVYTQTDKDDYIRAGGIIACPSDQGGIRVVRAVTTYQGTNLILNEWSMMREALYITKDHRIYVQALIGEAGDASGLESIKNRAKNRLDDYEEFGWFVIDPQFGNAWRNFVFTVTGDVVQIAYEGTLVSPINFALATHNFVVIGVKK